MRQAKSDLFQYGRNISSVFDLIGSQENDITASVGWVLSQCPSFLSVFLSEVYGRAIGLGNGRVDLQKYRQREGITDIEITTDTTHTIVEAKRGFTLPSVNQLQRYAGRFQSNKGVALVVLSDYGSDYAKSRLGNSVRGVPVVTFTWNEVHEISRCHTNSVADRRLLGNLRGYLGRVAKVRQDMESNRVYVVSLGSDRIEHSDLTWIDVVEKHRKYFHPVGVRGWPHDPPNYLGFRYRGHLQSIHHVDAWRAGNDIKSHVPEIDWGLLQEPHFLYTLGPAIKPSVLVKNGDNVQRNVRVWVEIDLLLTSKTISEALKRTKSREEHRLKEQA